MIRFLAFLAISAFAGCKRTPAPSSSANTASQAVNQDSRGNDGTGSIALPAEIVGDDYSVDVDDTTSDAILEYTLFSGKHFVQEAGARGLVNMGTTCYMNSLLQVLMHLESMKAAMSMPDDAENPKSVLRNLRNLYEREWQAGAPMVPTGLFRALNKYDSQTFTQYAQQDVHEAFVKLTDALELDMFSFSVISEMSCDNGASFKDIRDEKLTALLLPLKRKNKPVHLSKMVGNYFLNQKFNRLESCEMRSGILRTRLLSAPRVLALSVHRTRPRIIKTKNGVEVVDQKIQTAVQFAERIDGSMFPGLSESAKYRLVGVVNHLGTGPRSGHYTATVRKGEEWFEFNDSRVTRLDKLNTVSSQVAALFYELE